MAINIFTANTKEMEHSEIYCADVSQTIIIPTPQTEVDFCYCEFECEFEEKVLAKIGGTEFENDKSNWLAELSSETAGNITFELFKNGNSIGVITDDTFGIYNALGSITDHPKKATFCIEWEKVFTLNGIGQYHLEITQTNYGRELVTKSHKYNLIPYTDKNANCTIVLKSIQNGYIVGGTDYCNMNFEQQFRLDGKLIAEAPELEKDNYLTTAYKREQIQDNIIRNYLLEINMIPASISNRLIEDNLLGCELFISDYNIWNGAGVFRNLPVDPISFSNAEYYDRSLRGNFEIQFTDRKQDLLKRRFR